MIPGTDLGSIHGIAAALIAAAAAAIALVRRRRWNAKDALQQRLAGHLEDYLLSAQDDAARAILRSALKVEFRQRGVPRDEQANRIKGAIELAKSRMTLPQIAALNSTIEKIGYTA